MHWLFELYLYLLGAVLYATLLAEKGGDVRYNMLFAIAWPIALPASMGLALWERYK